MDRSYDSIPRQGEHLGRDLNEEPTTNVRAQEAREPTAKEPADDGIVQCAYNESEKHYRVRLWPEETEITVGEGYKEVGRAPDGAPLSDLFDEFPEKPHFVVFENQETGEVYFERDNELSDNWTADGRFDQVTVFEDEEAAASYAESRQKK